MHKGNQVGVIDRNGNVIVPIAYTQVGSFNKGRAIVHKGNRCGMVNEKGKEVIPTFSPPYRPLLPDRKIYNGEKRGVVDRDGNIVVPPNRENKEGDLPYLKTRRNRSRPRRQSNLNC